LGINIGVALYPSRSSNFSLLGSQFVFTFGSSFFVLRSSFVEPEHEPRSENLEM